MAEYQNTRTLCDQYYFVLGLEYPMPSLKMVTGNFLKKTNKLYFIKTWLFWKENFVILYF